MSEAHARSGKVVVNRTMSLDGYIAGPNNTMDWGGGHRGRHRRPGRPGTISSERSGEATTLRFRVVK